MTSFPSPRVKLHNGLADEPLEGDFSLASPSRVYGGGEDHAQAAAKVWENNEHLFVFV